MEKHFRVVWEIDQWAATPEEAIAKAILALPVPSNEDTLATVFDVTNWDTKEKVQIDTLELEGNAKVRFLRVLDGREDDPTYLAEMWDKDEEQAEEDDLQKTMDKCRDNNI